MKKLLTVMILFSFLSVFSANAQSYRNEEHRCSFEVDDNWTSDKNDSAIRFRNPNSVLEHISFEICEESDFSYPDIESYIINSYSDDALAANWSELTQKKVTVKEKYSYSDNVIINDISYTVFDKILTVTADGYVPSQLYFKCYTGKYAGSVIVFEYMSLAETVSVSGFDNAVRSLSFDDVTIQLNDSVIESDTSAYIENGRTMVPVRVICEALGFDVEWNENDKSVRLNNETFSIGMNIGESTVSVTDKNTNLTSDIISDVPALIKDSRTFLPLRVIAEAVGFNVEWNSKSRTVEINV